MPGRVGTGSGAGSGGGDRGRVEALASLSEDPALGPSAHRDTYNCTSKDSGPPFYFLFCFVLVFGFSRQGFSV